MEVAAVLTRLAVKRTDLECIHACLYEASVIMRQLAMSNQIQYTGIAIPPHLVYDLQYFTDMTATLVNKAPKV